MNEPPGRGTRWHVLQVVLLTTVAGIVLSGCLGAISRAEFEAMVQDRGGGVSAASLELVLDDLRIRSGSNDPEIRFGHVGFGSATAVFEVRNPTKPDELDAYTYRDEVFVGSSPVRLSSSDDLEASTVPISTFALDDLETLTDLALVEFGSNGGYAESLTLLAMVAPPVMQIDVESPRSSGTAVFGADGQLREFRR